MKKLLGMVSLFAILTAVMRTQDSGMRADEPGTDVASTQGKAIFVSRGCAKCHDDDANKKLPDGTTLLARLSQSKDPEGRLGTRLKNPQERHQVMVYMQSLFERQTSAQAGAKPH